MLTRIKVRGSNHLRVIAEIPDVPACLIEGRNGIGKSLAVRLLQLATGEQPYTTLPSAWLSLRDGLDEAEIEFTSLDGATSVRCVLRTSQWPEDVAGPVGEWLGTWSIDGSAAELRDVRRLVRVYRIAGDESIRDTIARSVREDAILVEGVNSRVERLFTSLDQRLAEVGALVHSARPAELEPQLKLVNELEESIRQLDRRLADSRTRLEELNRLAGLVSRVSSLTADAPALGERISQLDAELHALDERASGLEDERTRVQGRAEQDRELRDRLKEVEAALSSEALAAGSAQSRAESLAAELGVEPTEESVHAAIEMARNERSTAIRARTEIDATPRLRTLASSLGLWLERADAEGLGGQVIARLRDGRAVSVADLADGLREVRTELAAQVPDRAAAQLNDRIAELQRFLVKAETLERRVVRWRNAVQRLDKRRAQLNEMAAGLNQEAASEFAAITAQLDDVSSGRTDALVARAKLLQQLETLSGGETLDQLRARVTRDLDRLGLGEADVAGALASARTGVDESELRRDGLASELARRQEDIELIRAEVARATRRMAAGASYGWVRAAGLAHSLAGASEEQTARRLQELGARVENARERAGRARSSLVSLQQPLEDLADSIARSRAAISTRSDRVARVSALRALYESELSTWFERPEIQETMFGDGTRFLGLDLQEMAVRWEEKSGEKLSRPLEAFSSGERAFAYTLARLESLRGETAVNRLVALDEFGAFVARDRIDRLISFIQARVLGTIADQVLVILPLTQDYESQLAGTTGALHVDVARRAESVRANGYVAEPLSTWTT